MSNGRVKWVLINLRTREISEKRSSILVHSDIPVQKKNRIGATHTYSYLFYCIISTIAGFILVNILCACERCFSRLVKQHWKFHLSPPCLALPAQKQYPACDSSSYRLHCMPSHLIASSPARCRVVRPPGNLDRGQSFTIWLTVLQHRNYKIGLVSCANEQDLQHIVPDRFWNGLSLPRDVEVSWSQEEGQWDHRPRIGWSHLCD